ncbi:MAG: nitroreductase family protein [Blautia faecis]
MDFCEVIEKRRTIRDFENVAISTEIIERIIEAGLSPTNDHMRDWHYKLRFR